MPRHWSLDRALAAGVSAHDSAAASVAGDGSALRPATSRSTRLLKNRSGGEMSPLGFSSRSCAAEAEQADQLGAQRRQPLAADRRRQPVECGPQPPHHRLARRRRDQEERRPVRQRRMAQLGDQAEVGTTERRVQVLGHRSGERMDERPQVPRPVVGGDLHDQRARAVTPRPRGGCAGSRRPAPRDHRSGSGARTRCGPRWPRATAVPSPRRRRAGRTAARRARAVRRGRRPSHPRDATRRPW